MESPESSPSHDPLDATEKVPSSWLTDEELDGPPTLVAPPTQRRPIPSILRRNAAAPLEQAVADRIERASVGAPLHLTPAPAPAKPVAIARLTRPEPNVKAPELSTVVRAKARISSEQIVPDSGLWMNDITSRRTIPLRPPAEVAPAPEPAKVEIAWEPPIELAPEPAKVEVHWEPPVELAPEPAKVEVHWERPVAELVAAPPLVLDPEPATLNAVVEPADEVEPATLNAAVEPVPALVEPASEPALRTAPARKHKTKRSAGRRQPAVAADPTVAAASSEPRTFAPSFGAGMLQANKVRAKQAAPEPRETIERDAAPAFGAGMLQAKKVRAKQTAPEPQEANDRVAAPAFGAGMLQSKKVRAKRDDKPAQTSPSAASSTFGAGMLQARKSRAGLIAAVVLAAAAITAGYLATRGDSKPTAAAMQK